MFGVLSYYLDFFSIQRCRGAAGDSHLYGFTNMVRPLVHEHRFVLRCAAHELLPAALGESLQQNVKLLAFVLSVLFSTYLGLQPYDFVEAANFCLLYTSDAADETLWV